ncbi:WD40-repeat-containing domain protein [Polychytrium aggregatum]|uniref:WD40-repeat-containing domain protein n=1 Tax=Polychytrium aggregatum TaxID=110093 RepID=UPI0022FE77F4|nr:WD40-repeat-containing domain protein [Polychytrium aggregatum]KAI9205581.1 WD40-repeat-containing domain protein [Polychytrium aggregatum]
MKRSSSGCLAVGLAETCYLWTDSTGQVDTLQSQRNRDDHISSCAFSVDGTKVAVGTLSGLCTIYDVTPGSGYMGKLFSCQQSYPVCAISWNRQGVVSLGDRSGKILNYNGKNSIGQWIQTFGGAHTDRVVGLRWCPQGRLLASGGNDNRVFLWEIGRSSPKLELAGHSAAVRAIAWCPWQYNLLATGGGLDDRCIRFWNTDTGTCVKKVHTGSQVCAVLWSKSYRELISAQYRDENQLILWSYPSMEQVGTMPGHKERPIHMALSPDGQTVVTAASDENLKFWKCFPIKPGQKLLEPPGKLVTADDPLTNSLR